MQTYCCSFYSTWYLYMSQVADPQPLATPTIRPSGRAAVTHACRGVLRPYLWSDLFHCMGGVWEERQPATLYGAHFEALRVVQECDCKPVRVLHVLTYRTALLARSTNGYRMSPKHRSPVGLHCYADKVGKIKMLYSYSAGDWPSFCPETFRAGMPPSVS